MDRRLSPRVRTPQPSGDGDSNNFNHRALDYDVDYQSIHHDLDPSDQHDCSLG